MHFDHEGHVVVTPREWQAGLANPGWLTRDVWLVGTPWAFPTYAAYREFRAFLADRLGVHPNNIAVRGSTKIGFSISPKADKVWLAMRPESDLDLAIVDPDYYHFFERQGAPPDLLGHRHGLPRWRFGLVCGQLAPRVEGGRATRGAS
ncbi:MAG: hypothetical protein HYS12_17305 [Planctomycetes bacterium]|nr:hypothetical protein [Planctomycetota bacterium]